MRQRLLVIGLLVAAAVLIAVLWASPKLHRSPVLSGYVEGEALYMASPVAGRVDQMLVQRGDRVAAGQKLFVVDPSQLQGARDQASAEVAAAQAQAADARKGQRPVELAVFDANVAAAEATLRDADSRVAQAGAALSAAQARLSDVAPLAPGAARVEDVFFQTGEWAAANQPVLALLPDERIKVRFFVPQADISTYRVGSVVKFACDGCPAGLSAKVSYISPRPEFTPPVIYSRETRDRMVFLVEAVPSARLNPGQPVDVQPLERTSMARVTSRAPAAGRRPADRD